MALLARVELKYCACPRHQSGCARGGDTQVLPARPRQAPRTPPHTSCRSWPLLTSSFFKFKHKSKHCPKPCPSFSLGAGKPSKSSSWMPPSWLTLILRYLCASGMGNTITKDTHTTHVQIIGLSNAAKLQVGDPPLSAPLVSCFVSIRAAKSSGPTGHRWPAAFPASPAPRSRTSFHLAS
eukprot:1517570-Prymnesium_polylepis.1